MNSPRNHAMHGVALGLVAYLVMTMVLKQAPGVAERRSVLLACVAVMYMVMYGHPSFLPKVM